MVYESRPYAVRRRRGDVPAREVVGGRGASAAVSEVQSHFWVRDEELLGEGNYFDGVVQRSIAGKNIRLSFIGDWNDMADVYAFSFYVTFTFALPILKNQASFVSLGGVSHWTDMWMTIERRKLD